MFKSEEILTLKKLFMLKIKLEITQKFISSGTLDKNKDEASHLMGCESYFCTQKLHPRTRKIFDSWRPSFQAPKF